MTPFFVDCHSHVVPSGDDGAGTIEEGIALCREAARHGTAILFATPHVWPHLVLTEGREEAIRAALAEVRGKAGLELRLGWELTPTDALLDDDPARYALEGTDAVLMEVPFTGPADVLVALAELTESVGLRPVIAHPERTEAVLDRPVLADDLAERGWVLQVNSTSLLGRHGEDPADVGWDLLERGVAEIVASDGHRPTRPPRSALRWERPPRARRQTPAAREGEAALGAWVANQACRPVISDGSEAKPPILRVGTASGA
jgi:protein-tyrosine phosphatase